jgi:hypothetical protein
MNDSLRVHVEVVESLQATLTDGSNLLLAKTGEEKRERGRERIISHKIL